MKLVRSVLLSFLMLLVIDANPQEPKSQAPKERPARTKVVLLGTGTPVPDPDRSGPATAIVVGDSAYLVDFGPALCAEPKPLFLTEPSRNWNPAI